LKTKKRLGKILIEGGLITTEQLEKALPFQKKTNLKLGQFLVREGIVSESQIVDMVSSQLNLKKYSADKYPVDPALSDLIPADIAFKYQVAPLKRNGLLLTVAMTDPNLYRAGFKSNTKYPLRHLFRYRRRPRRYGGNALRQRS
jgi:type IV pilus assembly protein PilB